MPDDIVPQTHRHSLPQLAPVLLSALLLADQAAAGVSYRFDRTAASPGETVTVEAIYFNEGTSVEPWRPPQRLALQWQGPDGAVTAGSAERQGDQPDADVPPGGFARSAWHAAVPAQARGMQTVAVDNGAALLALRADTPMVAAMAATPAPLPGTVAAEDAPAQDTSGLLPAPSEHERPVFDRLGLTDSLSAYQPMYFAVGTRGRTTARFQLSAKYRLFGPPGSQRFIDQIYLGYTQTSLWDLQGDSRPFIDTTYNPSLFWYSDALWSSANEAWRAGMNAGVAHLSNGKGGDDSRSLNHVYLQPSLDYRLGNGGSLSFAPRVKHYFGVSDRNGDYADYHGHVDWMARWETRRGGPVLSALYRQGDKGRRTTQLDLSWPLRDTGLDLNGYLYVQYFNGYGETLLDYDRRGTSQIRVGLSVVP